MPIIGRNFTIPIILIFYDILTMPDRDSYRSDPALYTACYCEENALNLSLKLDIIDRNAFIAIVSNDLKQCPVWHQRAGRLGRPVLWDYHVLLVARAEDRWAVYDLDSDLPFPCAFETYCSEAFRPDVSLDARFCQRFRVIPIADYAAVFASDRRHMRTADGWNAPPPAYPPLRGIGAESDWTLGRLWDVSESDAETEVDPRYGRLMSLQGFIAEFSRARDASQARIKADAAR